MQRIATDLNVDPNHLTNFELNVHDAQPAAIVGLHKEFVSSARLDNLASSLVAVDALIEATPRDDAEVNAIFLFDHEEVGSQSAQGADSNIVVETTSRIYEALSSKDS